MTRYRVPRSIQNLMPDDRSPSTPPAQAVKSYAGGIHARNSARQEERKGRPLFPNLAEAAVTYKPGDNPQTLEEIGQIQRADAQNPDAATQPQELRPETVQGLKAIYDASQAQQAAKPPPAAESASSKKPAAEDLDPDDAALVEALRGARDDILENEREREAVARRVKEIDLAQGLLTNEFTQVVPIVPDKLTVTFRCLTTGENNELRLILYEEIAKDARKSQIGNELFGFYQTVASVLSINKTELVRHMTRDNQNNLVFERTIFERKLRQFYEFPMQLISVLGMHGAWFDRRVRELFVTTEAIKNG